MQCGLDGGQAGIGWVGGWGGVCCIGWVGGWGMGGRVNGLFWAGGGWVCRKIRIVLVRIRI